jgi:hypothetical protein
MVLTEEVSGMLASSWSVEVVRGIIRIFDAPPEDRENVSVPDSAFAPKLIELALHHETPFVRFVALNELNRGLYEFLCQKPSEHFETLAGIAETFVFHLGSEIIIDIPGQFGPKGNERVMFMCDGVTFDNFVNHKLEKFGDPAILPLVHALGQSEQKDQRIREILPKLMEHATVETLLRLFNHQDEQVQGLVLLQLSRMVNSCSFRYRDNQDDPVRRLGASDWVTPDKRIIMNLENAILTPQNAEAYQKVASSAIASLGFFARMLRSVDPMTEHLVSRRVDQIIQTLSSKQREAEGLIPGPVAVVRGPEFRERHPRCKRVI